MGFWKQTLVIYELRNYDICDKIWWELSICMFTSDEMMYQFNTFSGSNILWYEGGTNFIIQGSVSMLAKTVLYKLGLKDYIPLSTRLIF